ncbi:ATP-binding protein [Streptomyces cavernicola]|uniref:ATP-binding protein n=1 Tax=Streptomyces cavernicola TaxID=3043613 RepID=A0ABT6S2V0_9ACTN|nr:ATP-binding protein [Streptomyces sp. B-S-A6]MDI3402424.1 ATP-binding protein [Streptomyces sp. B-S-A6]
MTNNPTTEDRPTQLGDKEVQFEMRFTSTPRGARLARRLCGERLNTWGIPYGSDEHDALTLLVAELAANAVRHGRVPGRDFRLRLAAHTNAVRTEVTDTRGDQEPEPASVGTNLLGTGGRGLLLVACLATRWGWHPRTCGGPGKTVWAEYDRPRSVTVDAAFQP